MLNKVPIFALRLFTRSESEKNEKENEEKHINSSINWIILK